MAMARGAAAQTIAWHNCAMAQPTESHTGSSAASSVTPSPDARLERRPRGQALDAIAVKRAGAGKTVAGKPRDADMSKLAMAEAARRLAVDDQPDADAGADGDIGEVVEPPARAPAHLGQSRAVDVGVERRRNARRRARRGPSTSVPGQPGLGVS